MNQQFGYTPPGTLYPPYLNFTLEDGKMRVSIREPADANGRCGAVAAIDLPPEEVQKLAVWLMEMTPEGI